MPVFKGIRANLLYKSPNLVYFLKVFVQASKLSDTYDKEIVFGRGVRKLSKKKKCKNKEVEVIKHEEETGTVCGNLQLNNQVRSLDIWEGYHEKDATVFVSVYNSPTSTGSIRVEAFRQDGSSLFFNVPPGNTGSGTVDHAERINVSRTNQGSIDGRYSLDINLHSSRE